MRFSEFTNLLLESKINNIEQAVKIFAKLLEKYIKEPLFRYGGENGTVQIKNGIGILYLTNSGPAYQFNYIAGKIASIVVWRKQFNFRPGDYTLELNDLNLAQAGKKLIKYVLNPQEGDFNIQESRQLTTEEVNLLKEARRASPKEFFEIVARALSPQQDISSLSREEIAIVAQGAGVQVPTAIRHAKVEGTKGINTKFDLRKLVDPNLGNDPEVDDAGNKTHDNKVYHVSIMPYDPQTKKFESPKGNPQVDDMLRKFQGVMQKDLSPQEQEKNANEIFDRMESLVRLVSRGYQKSLVIYGGPGTGKTFTVKSTLQDEGLQQNKDWFMIKGKVTTAELYRNLYMHRKGRILVFDDTDSVWGDQEAANILKAALDSYDERLISWYSNRTVNISKMSDEKKEEFFNDLDDSIEDDPTQVRKFPSEFIFEGKIIFISNLPRDKFDDAVLSRSAKIDMSLSSAQMFGRLKHILPNVGDKEVPLEVKEEILQFLIDENGKGTLSAPSMRSFINAENVYKSGMTDWKELFYYL